VWKPNMPSRLNMKPGGLNVKLEGVLILIVEVEGAFQIKQETRKFSKNDI